MPDPGPRKGRGGSGGASRLKSDVSAKIARIDRTTMSWRTMASLVFGHDGTGTFSRRALPVPAIAFRISVSA